MCLYNGHYESCNYETVAMSYYVRSLFMEYVKEQCITHLFHTK